MKLATYENGTRDGRLVVVSRDLKRCEEAVACLSMQAALDDWENHQESLEEQSSKLNRSPEMGRRFEVENCLAPLPRAYEWVDGSAYINHIRLVRKARGAEPPEDLMTNPLVYQGGSGVFLGPRENIILADESWGCDFESEICVVLGDVPQGTCAKEAGKYVRLLAIANDVSLRNLIPEELRKGFGFFNSKPATAFAPCFVTPDEVETNWLDGRLNLPLKTWLNDEVFGSPDAGPEMHFSFYDLIEHICKTRSFVAGTILGSGTVSNEDRSKGSSCLAEKRMIEKIETSEISTPFLKYGDEIRIELVSENGAAVFGSIEQKVVPKP